MTTIISTFGSSQANAYCSLTEAHSIVASRAIDWSAWTEASTAARSAALIGAANEIDSIPWLEWVETARHDARMAPAGGSARARLTGQVRGVLRAALADQRAKAMMGGVAA